MENGCQFVHSVDLVYGPSVLWLPVLQATVQNQRLAFSNIQISPYVSQAYAQLDSGNHVRMSTHGTGSGRVPCLWQQHVNS